MHKIKFLTNRTSINNFDTNDINFGRKSRILIHILERKKGGKLCSNSKKIIFINRKEWFSNYPYKCKNE